MPLHQPPLLWGLVSVCLTLILAGASGDARGFRLPVSQISVSHQGTVEVTVPSTTDHYYVLYHQRELGDDTQMPISMVLGEDGEIVLRDALGLHPRSGFYFVEEYLKTEPSDLDDDQRDDLSELLEATLNPLNAGELINGRMLNFRDGVTIIPDRKTFRELSYQGQEVLIDNHLEDLEFVKFQIEDFHTNQPRVYFLNTERHRAHFRFMGAVGISRNNGGEMRGEIIFHPNVTAPSGQPGVFRWEFEPRDNFPFEDVERAYELLARSLPFIRNNLMYYPMPDRALPRYHREKDLYDASRVHILLEQDLFSDIAFLPLNLAEGFGRLRLMELDERPTSRDVVIYRTLPNEMPRVAGIVTEVPQTPLSHVNLRAIQDGLPNAFIRNASTMAPFDSLIGKQVYYHVTAEGYEIREATNEEVKAHFEDLRPTEPQFPIRDLTATTVRPLTEIAFEDSTSFGVKVANLATLHTFNLPEGSVPDGFGIPFYFYDEFMKHNGFYKDVDALLANPSLLEDPEQLEEHLERLRDEIKDADMPPWMWEVLSELQNEFAPTTPIRCRSSTNNEDLPGFSGAGLYDSFTHHPNEGHLSKSIKQVFASLWNFRAFEERDFYRIDHKAAAMGVLVHRNFSDEIANGVAVTTDPFYQTGGTFYLNTQVGEDLVTNPEADSVPEEILLDKRSANQFEVVRYSNRVDQGEQILSRDLLSQMHNLLNKIDASFRSKYRKFPWATDFAMEVEFKITVEGSISIKQARPWVF